jgi:hypothetical protein
MGQAAAATVNGCDPEALKKLQAMAVGPLYGAVDLVGAADIATVALDSLRQGGRPIPVEKRPLSQVSPTLDQLNAGQITGRVVAGI